jgi:glycosyltransferase involved in cell wall biosynthesis
VTLRVAVLATGLRAGGGIARYTAELLAALGRRVDVEVLAVVSRAGIPRLDALGPGRIERLVVPVEGQVPISLWERHGLDRALRRRGVQVVHGTKHLLPRTRLPTVLTVHDLVLLTWPGQFRLAKRLLLPRWYRRCLAEADRLVAVSQATADRLAARFPALAARTVVAPNGMSTALLAAAPEAVPGLTPGGFALVVGDLSPRKNLEVLLDVWPEVHAVSGLVLAVAGAAGWRSAEVARRLDALAAAGSAVRTGPLGDPHLQWAYRNARVCLFPSREEGFGLPVLEAGAFGCPVVAGTDAALVEAAGGGAVHVDPDDRAGWRDAILAAAAGPRPAPRPATTLPTWDAHAAVVVEQYRTAVGGD